MKYLNAKDLLPAQLVEQLQQYVQGVIYTYPLNRDNIKTGVNCPDIAQNWRAEMLKLSGSIAMVYRFQRSQKDTVYPNML